MVIRTIADPDIYRAAKLVTDQHGKEAGNFPARRADQLLDDGDLTHATFAGRDKNYSFVAYRANLLPELCCDQHHGLVAYRRS